MNVEGFSSSANHTLLLSTGMNSSSLQELLIYLENNLYTWGRNDCGQLGDGTKTHKGVPTLIHGSFVSIASGYRHSMALDSKGNIYSWGLNDRGQLGDGSTKLTKTGPTLINLTTVIKTGTFIAIACGDNHSMALDTDGLLYSWGCNSCGQLGDGTTTSKNLPTLIEGNYISISCGYSHSMALDPMGNLYCWGGNIRGQLGDGTTNSRNTPKLLICGLKFISIACGANHSMALDSKFNLYCWGGNEQGQLGDGTTTIRFNPTMIVGSFVSIACGSYHSLALDATGNLYSWGCNEFGQLGDGTTKQKSVPTLIQGSFVSIACGYYHSMALDKLGTLYSWGGNEHGQLGDGTTIHKSVPIEVQLEKLSKVGYYYWKIFDHQDILTEEKLQNCLLSLLQQSHNSDYSICLKRFQTNRMRYTTLRNSNSGFPRKCNSNSNVLRNSNNNNPTLNNNNHNNDLSLSSSGTISSSRSGHSRNSSQDFDNSQEGKQDKVFELHKVIIHNRCPKLLTCQPEDIPIVPHHCFEFFLQFLYANKFDTDNLYIIDILFILNLSRIFEFNELKQICQESFIASLSVKNVEEAMLFCKEFDLQLEFDWCLWFVSKNRVTLKLDELLKYFSDLEFAKRFINEITNLTLPTPKVVNRVKVRSLFEIMNTIFDEKCHSDCKILFSGEKIDVHKCILENRWDFFKSFSEDFMNKENNYNALIPLDFTNRMPIPSFKKLLKYLYTNRLDIDLVSAIWIMKYSGYYLLSEELEERCRKFINVNITKDNSLEALWLGVMTGQEFIVEKAKSVSEEKPSTVQLVLDLSVENESLREKSERLKIC